MNLNVKNNDFKYGNCPNCGMSWDGGEIPENLREHYSEPYKWSKIVGVEDPNLYDGISFYECPECKCLWSRWTGELGN